MTDSTTQSGDETSSKNAYGRPIGSDYDPMGDELTEQEAVDRIHALLRRAQGQCYPDDPWTNKRNGGRVRALAQAIHLLNRAGIQPEGEPVRLNDDEEMIPNDG